MTTTVCEQAPINFGAYHISQIEAGELAHAAIQRHVSHHDQVGLDILRKASAIDLGRSICLQSAVCTGTNHVLGARQLSANSIADMYRYLLPLHGTYAVDPITNQPLGKGWLVVTPRNDMYYHAIRHWIRTITQGEVEALSITGFNDLSTLGGLVHNGRTAVAISLDNRFVMEQIIKIQMETGEQFLDQRTDGNYFRDPRLGTRAFGRDRHVVTMLGYDPTRRAALISDPFLPAGMRIDQAVKWHSIDSLIQYIFEDPSQKSKGMILTTAEGKQSAEESVGEFIIPLAEPVI